MNEFAEALVDGLQVLEEAIGATITWNGKDYPCVGASELRGKRLDLGGWQFHSDTGAVVRASVFGEAGLPAAKQFIVYQSCPEGTPLRWRIDAVRTLWGEVLVLECNDPNQGA